MADDRRPHDAPPPLDELQPPPELLARWWASAAPAPEPELGYESAQPWRLGEAGDAGY